MTRTLVALGALAVLAWAAPASAQLFSPGQLSKAHKALEGVKNCAKCHPSGSELSAALCLDCHKELAGRVAARQGFHGHLGQDERQTCKKCHREHEGRDVALIDWGGGGQRGFDHKRAGWPLAGKHAAVACADCHDKRLLSAPIKALLGRAPERKTFLGLSTKCSSCHFDEHRGQLGADCVKCHTESAWKPAPKFDHARTDYPLDGKHAKVPCAKCHEAQKDDAVPAGAFPAPRAATFAKFKDVEHGACTDCHQDPHKGQFGANCASCHSTAGWQLMKAGGGADLGEGGAGKKAFHDKTRFPLKGQHAGVACKACHGPFPGQKAVFRGLPFAACGDCHADAHFGQLTGSGRKPQDARCERCHTEAGFVPARFEIEDHAATKYPLEGAHKAVTCGNCHKKDEAFAHKAFAKLSPKEGGARKGRPQTLAAIVLHPKGDSSRCETCHADPHAGQFDKRMQAQSAAGCTTCHRVSSWREVKFDHERDAKFALEGQHGKAACGGCHLSVAGPKGGPARVVKYAGVTRVCAGCHTDVHFGQFADAQGSAADCARCHNAIDFKKTSFAHNDRRFTTFALDGKHEKVECGGCHPTVRLGETITTRRYKPLPTACEGCHEDVHQGAFKRFTP